MAKQSLVIKRRQRCAIYTRKSSEEGLEQEFNSLHAQREACEAYIASQRAEGWVLVDDHYDDGGESGGTLNRPALQRLLADSEAGKIDIVVVYKIDRLSRSLMDFTKLVEMFERKGMAFNSVTQQFSTTSSMGRLTLNILLSFAQFEREMTGERIRDKIAASKRKGIWMGGYAPFGYVVRDRKLVIEPTETALVRSIFQRFIKLGSATKLVKELRAEDAHNRYGKHFDKGSVYRLLNNCVYMGEVSHKGVVYPGEHTAAIERSVWDKVHSILKESPRVRGTRNRANTPAILKGLIFSLAGAVMTPTHTRKHGRLYRYYITSDKTRDSADPGSIQRVSAAEIEGAVLSQIRIMVQSPEIIVATWKAAKQTLKGLTEGEVRFRLLEFGTLWAELFPAEQARLVQLLVSRVQIATAGLDITLRTEGLTSLIQELLQRRTKRRLHDRADHYRPCSLQVRSAGRTQDDHRFAAAYRASDPFR